MQVGAAIVPYYLNEEQGWKLQVEELHRALESAKGICNPVALYVINPGNPSGSEIPLGYCISVFLYQRVMYQAVVAPLPLGHVQSRQSIQEVIQFVSEQRLFLLADEVAFLTFHPLAKHNGTKCVNWYVVPCCPPQVYQEYIYGEKEFVSYKRVLGEMGPPLSDTVELASFYSASKGFLGE